MTDRPEFHFEPASHLPGRDRITKYGLAGIRRLVDQLWDVTVEGVEHVPRHGAAIIAPNHLAFCDSIFVPASLPRRVWAIGKNEYMEDWKTRYVLPALGMIPVNRAGGEAAQTALDTAASVLDSGHLFMIYPEGTRSRSGLLHKGRTGAARLAARCNAPILPVGHQGTTAIQPVGSSGLKLGKKCTIRIGAPVHVQRFGDPADPRVLRRYTDAIMRQIAALSGQEYVHQYVTEDDKPGQPALTAAPHRLPALNIQAA